MQKGGRRRVRTETFWTSGRTLTPALSLSTWRGRKRGRHRPGLCLDVGVVRPAALEFNDLGLYVGGQGFDDFDGVEKSLKVFRAAGGADGGADLGETIGKSDAEFRPGFAAGPVVERGDFYGALAEI